MKLLYYSCLLCLIPACSIAQTPNFSLQGQITDIETGTVKMWQPQADSSFYLTSNEIPVDDGRFQFSGYLESPRATAIAVFDQSGILLIDTEWFYIDPGEQELSIASAEAGRALHSNSVSFRENVLYFSPVYDSLSTAARSIRRMLSSPELASFTVERLDSLQRQRNRLAVERGIFLLQYILDHPRSYVALTELAAFIDRESYLFAEKAFDLLHPDLQQSPRGQAIRKAIANAGAVQAGQNFPDFNLQDTSGLATSLSRVRSGTFTLVDFWFHSCGFCIQQFPELKNIYEQYRDRGFEVIGVTVDRERFEVNWKEAIRVHGLPWPQYWDFDGLQCNTYMIEEFPSNFLLDADGVILGVDLDMEELAKLLGEKL